MNDNQRIAIVVPLVIIGLVLLLVMVEWGDGSGIRFGTRIISFYQKSNFFNPGDENKYVTDPALLARLGTPVPEWSIQHIGLYVRNGIPGILLGIVTPLSLWAVAAYIALGSKKVDAST